MKREISIDQGFTDWLKEEVLPGVWSKGVQLSRAFKGIELVSESPEEMKFKIKTTERTLAFVVTLWPKDLDAHCNCDSKIEPCHHIVAVTLACENGLVQPASQTAGGTRIIYHWVAGLDRELKLVRSIQEGEKITPLAGSLVALIGGIQSGRIKGALPSASTLDLKIDEMMARPQTNWPELLRAMSELPPLRVEGVPGVEEVQAKAQPLKPILRLRDQGKEIEVLTEAAVDDQAVRLKHDLVIARGELALSPPIPAALNQRFSPEKFEQLVTLLLPQWQEKYEVVIESRNLPELVDAEPRITFKIHALGDTVAVTPEVSYGELGNRLPRRDPKREQELMKEIRSKFQLSVGQTSKLNPEQAFRFRELTGPLPALDAFIGSLISDLFSDRNSMSIEDALQQRDSIMRLLELKESNPAASKVFAAHLASKPIDGAMDDFEALELPSLPRSTWNLLRDYQKEGVRWLLQHQKAASTGAILADDMGLGKTVQTLCVIQTPALVVVPTSLLHNWQNELRQFRPDLSFQVFHGSGRTFLNDKQVTITTYGILRQEATLFQKQKFNSIVFDEAHLIRNQETLAATAALNLRAPFKIALTGTPVQNKPRDLLTLFELIQPGLFPDVESLKKDHTAPYILRRTKSEVLTELPPKSYLEHTVELTGEERKWYQAVWNAAKSRILSLLDEKERNPITLFEVLLRSRQVCDHVGLADPAEWLKGSAKLELLLDLIHDLREAGHSVLVYSQWTRFLDRIEVELKEAKLPWLRLDGQTRNRGEVLEQFQNSRDPAVFLLSLHAGGVGLNLTKADHVIFCDPWWNPYVELQAEDRAYRMGQEKPVTIHRLIAGNTIEEKIRELQMKKKALEQDYLDVNSKKEGNPPAENSLQLNDIEWLLKD